MRRTMMFILLVSVASVFAQDGQSGTPSPSRSSQSGAVSQEQPAGGDARGDVQEQPQTCMGGGGIVSFIPMIAIFAIFYFLMIRPQQKQAKMLKEMRDSFSKGDRVVTSGGIHGVITNLKGDIVTIRIADGVKVEVDRNSLTLDRVERKEED